MRRVHVICDAVTREARGPLLVRHLSSSQLHLQKRGGKRPTAQTTYQKPSQQQQMTIIKIGTNQSNNNAKWAPATMTQRARQQRVACSEEEPTLKTQHPKNRAGGQQTSRATTQHPPAVPRGQDCSPSINCSLRIPEGGENSGHKHVRWDRRHPAHQNNPGTAQSTSLASVFSGKLFRSRCVFFWRFGGFGREVSPNLAIMSCHRQNRRFSPKSKRRNLKSSLETTDAKEVSCAVPRLFWCAGWRRSHLTCF
jgi:hypothetical protein